MLKHVVTSCIDIKIETCKVETCCTTCVTTDSANDVNPISAKQIVWKHPACRSRPGPAKSPLGAPFQAPPSHNLALPTRPRQVSTWRSPQARQVSTWRSPQAPPSLNLALPPGPAKSRLGAPAGEPRMVCKVKHMAKCNVMQQNMTK